MTTIVWDALEMSSKTHIRDETFAAMLLDAKALAAALGCSVRHVYRLTDMGRIPRPVKLGALTRWSLQSIEDWVARGCPCCG